MVRVDVFSSVGAFTHQTTRYPRIVVPSLWSTDHLRAFCVDKALDYAHLVPTEGERYRPTPGQYAEEDEGCWEDPISADVVEDRKRRNIISSFGGNIDDEGRMSFVQEETPRRFAEQILDDVVSWMQEGTGRDLFPQNTICSPNWYLEHMAASMSENAVNVPFTCLAWKVDLPIADVLSMVRTDECEAVQHIVAIVSPHIITASRARTLGITARDRRKDYHSIKRLRESVRLEDESRRGKLPSTPETVDPMHVAILLGMCQKQWELDSGKRKYYSAHIFTYLLNETDEEKPALTFITITGRFSASYFQNLNKLKPQRPSRTAAASAPTTTADSLPNARSRPEDPLPDEMEIKVRTIDLLPANSDLGNVEPIIRNLYFLLGHLGSLVEETAQDMGIPVTRRDDTVSPIDFKALEGFFATSTSTTSTTITSESGTSSTTTTTFISTTVTETTSISSDCSFAAAASSAGSISFVPADVNTPLRPVSPVSPNSRKRRSPSEETESERDSPPKRVKKAPKPLLYPSAKPVGPRPPPPSSKSSSRALPSTPSKERRALGNIDVNKFNNIRSPLQRVKEDLLAKPNLKTATPMMTPRSKKRGHDGDDLLGQDSPSPTQKRRIAASA